MYGAGAVTAAVRPIPLPGVLPTDITDRHLLRLPADPLTDLYLPDRHLPDLLLPDPLPEDIIAVTAEDAE